MIVSERWHLVGIALVLCLITGVVYWPGLSGSFMFDDYPNIVDNVALRVYDGSLSSLVTASSNGGASPLGRPLSVASFALNWHAYGANPFYFKLVNLLIHLANGLLVFVLVRQLLARLASPSARKSSLVAIWVTAVWLLHPMNLTPVLFVVQRMTGLAAFFTLAALCLYLYGRQAPRKMARAAIATSLLLFWPAAVFSKETGVLLPLFIFLCEWLILGSFRTVSRKIKWLTLLSLSLALVGLLIAKWDWVVGSYAGRDFGLFERLMTEARVLWFYVLQLLAPLPNLFSLYHDDIPISHGLLAPPQTLLAILAWLFLIAIAIYQRQKTPLFAFAVFWFLAAHILESTFLSLEIAYEHRNYLASLGVFTWLGTLLFPQHMQKDGQVARLTLALSFLFFCGLITALRADQWGDEYRRTQLEVAGHPNSARTNYDAAVIIARKSFDNGGGNGLAYQMAQFHYKRAAELKTTSLAPYLGLLNLDCATGRPKDLALQSKLQQRFATTRFTAENQTAVIRLSVLLVEGQLCLDAEEVKALLNAALSNPAANGYIRAILFSAAMDYAAVKLRAPQLALNYARAAVASDPTTVPFRINLTHLLLATNAVTEARREYNAILKLNITSSDKASFDALSRRLILMERNADPH